MVYTTIFVRVNVKLMLFVGSERLSKLGIYNMKNTCMYIKYYTEHCAACSNQTQTARVYQDADSSLSKHEDLTQCCFNVGPAPLVVGKY